MSLVVKFLKLCVVWLPVAVIFGVIISTAWPPKDCSLGAGWLWTPFGFLRHITIGLGVLWRASGTPVRVGIGFEWWNLPGTMIGFTLGLYLSSKRWTDKDLE
jgi:hypothetical protein